jgi:hypothetical protein
MLVLYLLGRDLESILGQRHFLYLYLAGAVAGELGHLFLMPPDSVLLAASGGVAAVVVAYATILPELELTAMMFFVVPVRLKAKHLAYGLIALAIVLICIDRTGMVGHSAYLGGCAAGWLYAHLLGFGRPSFLQRFLRQHRAEVERYEQMSLEQLMAEEIDPLLEKISRDGFMSLTRRERRSLFKARENSAKNANRLTALILPRPAQQLVFPTNWRHVPRHGSRSSLDSRKSGHFVTPIASRSHALPT